MKNKSIQVSRSSCIRISPVIKLASALFLCTIGTSYLNVSYAETTNSVSSALVVNQQNSQIKGNIVDNYGEPVIGAAVVVDGTNNLAYTDLDGNFAISAKSGDVLKISMMGFVSQSITVTDAKNINIALKEDAALLDEVVVIGYGTALKSDLTGSLTSVGEDSFKEQRVTSVDQALQGRASGVQVTTAVGAPGGDVKIRIRGANSVVGDNDPLFVIDGFIGADFSLLNPNDIASMEILKDASSTAIYGSRGSNGVILVTTKGGSKKDGKVNVSYSGSVSVSNVIGTPDMLSAGDYASLANAYNEAVGVGAAFTDTEVQYYYDNGGFDYLDALYRTAFSHQHQLSVSGGTEKTQYRISGNMVDQQGTIEESSYKRYTFRANLSTKVNDKLSFRFNFNGGASNAFNNQQRTGSSIPVVQAMAWAPTTDPYDGEGGYTISDPTGSIKTNPLALIYDKENIYNKTFINTLGGVRYEIIPGLSADFQSSADLNFYEAKTWSGNYATNYSPTASKTQNKTVNIQTTSQLSYNKTFNDVHKLDAVVAFETQARTWEQLYGYASDLVFPELKYDNLAQASSNKTTTDYSKWSLLSYLARVNYSYNSKYLASISVRRDGSSKFADGKKYGTFPAAALAWNIANEDFIKNLDIFSKLKLRLSWGFTGSQSVDPYTTLSGYNTSIYYAYNTSSVTNGIQIDDPGNSDLTWETTEQKDIGLEFGFLDGRLNFEIDYYRKNTRDLLLEQSVAYYQGGGSLVSNVGEIANNGVEVTVSADVFKKKDFSWNTNFNFSYAKNTVIDLGDETQIFSSNNYSGLNGQPEFVYQVGETLGSFWGYNYLGPWQADEAEEAAKYGCVPGDARYEDLDGNYVIDGSDCQIIGDGMPDVTIGWNNTITYKKFTLNAFFQGVFGVQKLNYTNCLHTAIMGDSRYATLELAKERYIPGVQEDTFYPSWSTSSVWQPQSTMFLEDASYIRLKNLSLCYDLTVKKVGDIRLSLNATNLFTITGYSGVDPESSNVSNDIEQGIDYGSYPNSKTITFGIDITF